MEVVVTTGAISCAKLQSNHHHQQTEHPTFYRPDALLVTQPTVSEHWRENMAIHRLAFGLPTLPLTTNSSWFPWGTVAMPLISPRMPVTPAVPTGTHTCKLSATNTVINTHTSHTSWVHEVRYCILRLYCCWTMDEKSRPIRSVLYAIPAHC